MRIYLVGYMGSGKTTAGRRLASRTGLPFFDLDMMIEEQFKISLPDLFRKYDEYAFRKIEQKMLHSTQYIHNAVISTGGGTPCFFDNMQFILDHGVSVYVKMSPVSLYHRLLNSRRTRPVIGSIPHDNLQDFIVNQLADREKFYSRADHIVKGENLDLAGLAELVANGVSQE